MELADIDAIYGQARALENAAGIALLLAVRAGAKNSQVEKILAEAVSVSKPSPPGLDEEQEALAHLAGRRNVCLAVTQLALQHGVAPQELVRQLQRAAKNR